MSSTTTGADAPATTEPVAAPDGAGPDALLTAALATAQRDFPTITKSQTAEVKGKDGKAGYTYAYADLGEVLNAVRPVLAANGLAITQATRRAEGGKTILETEIRHIGGGKISSEVDLGQDTRNPQSFGGALTYLRRYEATTLLGVAAEEDRDAQEVERGAGGKLVELPGWAKEATVSRAGEWTAALAPLIGLPRTEALTKGLQQSWGYLPSGAAAIAKAIAPMIAETLGPEQMEALAASHLQDSAESPAQDATEAPEPAPAAEEEPEPHDGPPTTQLAPASVDHPDTSRITDPAKVAAAYRAAGCICADVVAPNPTTDSACPIIGHGATL